MKLYVAGPMRGVPLFGQPAFKTATTLLRSLPWITEVFNPAERDESVGFDSSQAVTGSEEDMRRQNFSLREALGADLAYITQQADGVVLLNGWEKSLGAIAERNTAHALGLDIYTFDGTLLSKIVQFDDATLDPVVSVNLNNDGNAASSESTIDKLLNGGEVRTTSIKGGQKGVKLARYDLIPAGPLRLLAEHYGRGASKYADRQWEKGYPWSNSFAALQRHAWDFWNGKDYDTDEGPLKGSPSLAAVAWHAFSLMQFMQDNRELDDRPTSMHTESSGGF